MTYTNIQKTNGELAIRTLSEKAQKGYSGTDLLTVYEVERDDYQDDDGWHTKKTYDVAVYGEDVVENMTHAELDEYLTGWYVEEEKEYHVLPQYLDEFGYIDEDYVLTSSELAQLANDWGKNPADLMHMLEEI